MPTTDGHDVAEPEQILTAEGWQLRPGRKPGLVVAEHEVHGRRIYAGSAREILAGLIDRKQPSTGGRRSDSVPGTRRPEK